MLTPKHVLYIAISNYLSVEQAAQLKEDCIRYKRLGDVPFVKIVQKHFDFHLFKNKPFIPEDIWLFNYLMYEAKPKGNRKIYDIGEKIEFKGRLPKKGLILKYHNHILLPQLEILEEAHMILQNLY
jgi:hypothetical protein